MGSEDCCVNGRRFVAKSSVCVQTGAASLRRAVWVRGWGGGGARTAGSDNGL